MDCRSILEILDANGIKVHPKFERTCLSVGCIPQLRDLYDGVLQEMSDLLLQGINCAGMTGPIRKNIDKLSGLLVLISQKTSIAEHAKLEAKLKKLTGNIKIEEGVLQMKNEVLRWISAYQKGVDEKISRESAPERLEILHACNRSLDQIKTMLDNVIDVTSQDALSKAEQIVEALKAWSKNVAMDMHSRESLEELEAIQKIAKSWIDLRQTNHRQFRSKKEIDLTGIHFDPEKVDDLELIQVGFNEGHLENIRNFKLNLSQFKEGLKNRYDVESERTRLAEKEQEMDELYRRAETLQADFQNGRISPEDAEELSYDLEEQMQDIENEISDLRSEITNNEATYKARKSLAEKLDTLLGKIEKIEKTDPEELADVCQVIDFQALHNLMHGKGDENDAIVLELLQKVENRIAMRARNASIETAKRMNGINAAHRKQAREDRAQHSQQNSNEQKTQLDSQSVQDRLSRLANRGSRYSRPTNQQPQEPQEQKQDQQEQQQESTAQRIFPHSGGFQA